MNDRRRGVNESTVTITVAIGPIRWPAMSIRVVLIPTASVIVTAVVMPSLIILVFGEGWRHAQTADH